MMNPFDLLVTFAELAVSYIGFASIVAAIQTLGGRTWEPLDKLLFRGLIEGSIVGVFLSMIPVTLSAAGVQPEPIWIISSLLALVVSVSAPILRRRNNQQFIGRQPRVGQFVMLPLALSSIGLTVANLAVWRGPSAYVFVMLIWVAIVSANFLTLVFRFFPLGLSKDSS
jgi:energy-converting hydrogenase Eha subunit C